MTARTVARITAALMVAIVTSGISGCARHIDGPTLVLRLATPDRQTDPTGAMAEHFAEEVSNRSGGTIRIDPVWDVTPDGTVGWDQTVANGVANGTWEMGLVPGRAWDLLGVDSLRALNTPFLITSEPALRAVLDSDLRDDLLAGLPEAGVTGVDLFPDGLRHPFGYDQPLLGVQDYAGQTIWGSRSDTESRIFGALGASMDDSPDSRQRGAEAQYELTPGQVATGNVTYFPKTNALVLRTSTRDHLRDDQWSLLVASAAATRHWLYSELPSDQESADGFCEHGGSIVAASPDQIAGLHEAVQPAIQWLRRDPDTRRLIDEIGDLVHDIPDDAAPVSCPAVPAPTSEDTELASLDGTYVTRVTQKQLREAGEGDPHLLLENSGRLTWVLDRGTWTYHQTANHYIGNPDDSGSYTYRDGVFTMNWDDAGDLTSARLQVDADGTIHFLDIVDAHAAAQALSEGYFASPWTRVGGVPD